MSDLLSLVKGTSLSNILVLAGIAFWMLAIAGSVAGKITVDPGKQTIAGLVGSVFIGLGLVLLYFPGRDLTESTPNPATSAGPTSGETKLPPEGSTKQIRASPSFNCATNHAPVELKICGSRRLSDLDREMNNLYHALSERLDRNHQTALTTEQAAWLRQRAECRDEPCLIATYESRIAQLKPR
jgi:uncharacterized protein YecT (DUF1311 family)